MPREYFFNTADVVANANDVDSICGPVSKGT